MYFETSLIFLLFNPLYQYIFLCFQRNNVVNNCNIIRFCKIQIVIVHKRCLKLIKLSITIITKFKPVQVNLKTELNTFEKFEEFKVKDKNKSEVVHPYL